MPTCQYKKQNQHYYYKIQYVDIFFTATAHAQAIWKLHAVFIHFTLRVEFKHDSGELSVFHKILPIVEFAGFLPMRTLSIFVYQYQG